MNKNKPTEEEWVKQLRCKVQNHEEKLPETGWYELVESLKIPSRQILWKKTIQIIAAAAIGALILLPFAGNHSLKKSVETSTKRNLAKTSDLRKSIPKAFKVASLKLTATAVETKTKYRQMSLKKGFANEIMTGQDTISEANVQNNKESVSTDTTSRILQKEHLNYFAQKVVIPDYGLCDKELSKKHNVAVVFAMVGNGICSNVSGRESDLVRIGNESNLSDDGFSRSKVETPFVGQTQVEMKHKIPLKMVLLVSKRITNVLSIETGLTGTYLSSVPRDELLGSNYDQIIYYIGVPVKISYYFYHQKGILLYWSNGVESEKCISAKRGNMKLHLNKLQWSVNSGFGIQMNVSSNVGLFAEPGVSYYWGNGTKIETFRTEHPLSIELHFGLKLNL